MDALLHRWLNEDADIHFGLPIEDPDTGWPYFDNKENIPPVPPNSPLPDFLNWTPPPSPKDPPVRAPLGPLPTAAPISNEDRQKAAQTAKKPALRMEERIKRTESIVFKACKAAENPTWPGFTFFQLTPLSMDIFHKDPPLYKYPLSAFIEALAYKDTRERNNLALPKKFGGASAGHYRQFVEMQDTGIIEWLYMTKPRMDLLAYRSIIPTKCGYPMIILYDWRNHGCVFYDIYHFLMELVSHKTPDFTTNVGLLIPQAIQYMGHELSKRVFKADVFDGTQVMPLAFGDPFVTSYFGLFVSASLGIPFQALNDAFYFFNVKNTCIWALQYPPHNRSHM